MDNNISLYKSALHLAAILLIILPLNIKADSYKSIIRYDRIWECSIMYEKDNYIKCMKFGDQKDFLNNTYTEIVTFKKTIPHYNNGNYTYDTIDGVWESEGFLREENGMVYSLVVETGEFLTGIRYTSDYVLKKNDILTEVPIYNFNVEPDDSIELFTFLHTGGYYQKFKVTSKSTEIIDDEVCLKLGVSAEFEYGGSMFHGPERFFIESLGATNYGCLNYTEFGEMATNMNYINYIERVFDIEGNVIFKGMAFHSELQYGSFSILNKIKDDIDVFLKDDMIVFGCENSKNSISIYDMSGRKIKELISYGRQYILTSDFKPGVYVMIASCNEKVSHPLKFIVH